MAGATPRKVTVSTPAPAAGGARRVTVSAPAKASERPASFMDRLWETTVQTFTWWRGQTIGTRVHTWRFGELVGHDEFGNAYYQTRGGAKDPALGFCRRWVIYQGEAEASRIPPGWFGWLQHRQDVPPSREDYRPREWQKPHKPNMTGTDDAYRPMGSVTLDKGTPGEENPRVEAAYEAWSPK